MIRRTTWLLFIIFWMGTRDASAKEILNFNGVIDFQKHQLQINYNTDKETSVKTIVEQLEKNKYHFKFDITHLNICTFDLSSQIEGEVEIKKLENVDPAIIGTLWSNYSMVDFKPVRELSGSYKIENKKLTIANLLFGPVGAKGLVDLADPYKLDVLINIDNMPMSDFLKFWMRKDKYESSSGDVAGEIKATGTLDQPYLKGNFKSFHTNILDYNFDSIVLNMEGTYPHFTIDNTSNLSKADGMSFLFNGPITIDGKNLKSQIKNLKVAAFVKESDTKKEWTIKRFNEAGENSAEVKYFIRTEDVVGSKDDEETAIFGIERSTQF